MSVIARNLAILTLVLPVMGFVPSGSLHAAEPVRPSNRPVPPPPPPKHPGVNISPHKNAEQIAPATVGRGIGVYGAQRPGGIRVNAPTAGTSWTQSTVSVSEGGTGEPVVPLPGTVCPPPETEFRECPVYTDFSQLRSRTSSESGGTCVWGAWGAWAPPCPVPAEGLCRDDAPPDFAGTIVEMQDTEPCADCFDGTVCEGDVPSCYDGAVTPVQDTDPDAACFECPDGETWDEVSSSCERTRTRPCTGGNVQWTDSVTYGAVRGFPSRPSSVLASTLCNASVGNRNHGQTVRISDPHSSGDSLRGTMILECDDRNWTVVSRSCQMFQCPATSEFATWSVPGDNPGDPPVECEADGTGVLPLGGIGEAETFSDTAGETTGEISLECERESGARHRAFWQVRSAACVLSGCPIPETERWGWGTDAYDGRCCDRNGQCQASNQQDDGGVGVPNDHDDDGVNDPDDADPTDPDVQ